MIRPAHFATVLAVALVPILSGCGLQSMYAQGANGTAANLLRDISVAPVAGKSGWLVRNALRDRLEAARQGGAHAPRYRLDIKLDDQIAGFGVRADDTVTRERRTLRARYQLVELANGAVLIDATAGSDAGVDVVSSEYATIAAEDSALERLSGVIADQIVARLSLYAQRSGGNTGDSASGSPAPVSSTPAQ